MNYFEKLLSEHAFFKGIEQQHLDILAGCCSNKVFEAGEVIGHEGDKAENFFLIREGKVAVQIATPSKGPVTVQTLGEGEIIGWSWLFPPYQWNFDLKAIEKTRTIALDAKCLRKKCDEIPELGYLLMKKFSFIMIQRLKSTRMQILNIYETQHPL